jgi:lysophospholipase L1-like esterase
VKRLVVVLTLAAAGTAAARSAPLEMTVSKTRGHIALALQGPAGAQVDVSEGARPVAHVVLDAHGAASVPDAGTWSCRRRHRRFTAVGTAIEAVTSTTTPSCAHRYAVSVRPRHPRARQHIRISARDRFHLQPRPRVCVQRRCRRGALRTTLDRGRYRVRVAGRATKRLRVRRPHHLRLLATGDSMIQIVDGFLGQQLAGRPVSMRSDARISSGLSKPDFFDWPAHARKQVRTYHPDVTVVFIGANDGYAIDGVPCCGRPWRRRYARVVVHLSRTYERSGRVYWTLLAAPRPADYRRAFAAVNGALRIAARRHRSIRLIDLPRTFTPGFTFRQSIPWNGTRVSVRADDGIHFNYAGASIAASLMIRRMARTGAL